jgi:hypothetical protein
LGLEILIDAYLRRVCRVYIVDALRAIVLHLADGPGEEKATRRRGLDNTSIR